MPPKAHHKLNAGNGLTLRTLGAMALWRDGHAAPLLGPGKPVALLTYLALTPGRAASREHLVELLWSDADPERARHALRQTLWQLRQLLGDDAFEGKDEVALRIPVPTDRDRFLSLVEAGDLEAATRTYSGHFLPAFASAGGAAFEHWADSERDRLRTTFVRAMERLARRQLADGHPREALATARRLVAVGEEVVIGRRLALEAHLALGDQVSAAGEADALERWSKEDEWPLDALTRAAIERARTTRPEEQPERAIEPARPLVAELIGREHHFATILAAWGAVRSGGSRHLHIVAPAGLGKTRLLHELESRLRHTGGTVRYLRAHPGDRQLPYALAAEMARALASLPGARGVAPQVAATLVALDPALANNYDTAPDQATGDEARRRRAFALSELLRATSEEQPIALLVDDIHWVDADSLVLLEALLARRDEGRVLLLTATRPVAERQLRSEGRTTITLAPLTAEQIGELLDSIASRDETIADLAEALRAATDGNPLLLLELLQLARDRGLLTIAEGRWHAHDPSALRTLLGAGEGIRQRLGRLGPESREIMQLLALAGHPLNPAVIAAATAAPPAAALAGLHLLERQGFVQPVGDEWEPSHDELAEAALPKADDGTLRRRLATAMEQHQDDSPAALSRAMQQWRQLDDVAAMARITSRALRRERHAGRAPDPEATVAALLAGAPDARLQRRVTRALPASLRWRRRLPALAVGTALLVLAGARALAGMLDQPEAVLGIAWYDRNGTRVEAVAPIGRSTWTSDDPLKATPKGSPLLRHFGPEGPEYDIRYSAGGDSAITTMRRPGTSNLEIVLVTSDTLIWLTDSERDDVAPAFTPDGSGVVFLSSRWSPVGDDATDVAVVDFQTRQVRQVTASRHVDHRAVPSPDGTRIGFVRNPVDTSEKLVCTVFWDGTSTSCRPVQGVEPVDAIGWLDNDRLLLAARRGGTGIVAAVDLRSGGWTSVVEHTGARIAFDHAQGILACLCEDPDSRVMTVRVARLDGNADWRSVALPPGARTDRIEIRKSSSRGRNLAHLSVSPPGPLSAGASHRLRAVARTRQGEPVAFDSTTLRWSSDAPDVVAIDSLSGVAVPLREGQAMLRVTAGGWRSDSLVVTVQPSRAEVIHLEEWRPGNSTWRFFGDPLPSLGGHPAFGNALHLNGDGVFAGGVYRQEAIGAGQGVTVELELSTPVNRDKWQVVSIDLAPGSDSALLAAWDHRTSFPPGNRIRDGNSCGFGFPNGEGLRARGHLSVSAGSRSEPIAAPPTLGSGASYRLRLMLGADGRCHVAINGTPMHVSSNVLPVDLPLRLWILGNSVGTDIAIGKLTIWKGDPGGVNWLASPPRNPPPP